MVKFEEITNSDLEERLAEWDAAITQKVLVVACGGTALTLKGYKPSTKDIDFLVPRLKEHDHLVDILKRKLGYAHTDVGFRDPTGVYKFDLYRGNTIFQTGLLDPVEQSDRHEVVKVFSRLLVGVLNSYDLIISKMFRGDAVDVQDSITLMKAEPLDIENLANRYVETAQYYFNELQCKKNLRCLVDAMRDEGMEPAPLEEALQSWNPV